MTSDKDSIPSAIKAKECPMNPVVHLSEARTKLNPMPISEDFKPRWIICSGVCLLAILRHYRHYLRQTSRELRSQRRFGRNPYRQTGYGSPEIAITGYKRWFCRKMKGYELGSYPSPIVP